MTVRVRKVERTTQPQEFVSIASDNPLAANLSAQYLPTNGDILEILRAKSVAATFSGGGKQARGPLGLAVQSTAYGSNAVGGDYVAIPAAPENSLSAPLSWEILLTVGTLSSGAAFPIISGILTKDSQASRGCTLRFNPDATSGNYNVPCFIAIDSGGNETKAIGVGASGGQLLHLVGTWDGTTATLWQNGISYTGTGARTIATGASNSLVICTDYLGDSSNLNRSSDHLVYYVRIWSEVLPSAKVAALYSNPWQLFEPEQIVAPAASGTTAYTLTAATSAFTLTGTTTGLKADRKLPTSVATFTETGNAASLAVGRKLAATTSAFTLTGVAAALKADRKLAPSVSPYTFTGNDTTLTYSASGNKSITADAVSFALTGSNANLTVQRKLASSVSAFTLTGNDSALSYQRKLPAGVGAFTLTGIDVALSTTGTELPTEQTKGGAGRAKIKKKRLKVQKRELDETLQQLIDDLTEDRNYQTSQQVIEEAVEELKENLLDQIQPKELTKEEITEALVVTTVSLKLTAMEVSLSEKLDKITKELEKTNRYVQSLEELVILLNNT